MSKNVTDRAGRPWAKLSQLRAGQMVELDGSFTCRPAGFFQLQSDKDGLYFACSHGSHHIGGQADDGEHCVGVYCVEAA